MSRLKVGTPNGEAESPGSGIGSGIGSITTIKAAYYSRATTPAPASASNPNSPSQGGSILEGSSEKSNLRERQRFTATLLHEITEEDKAAEKKEEKANSALQELKDKISDIQSQRSRMVNPKEVIDNVWREYSLLIATYPRMLPEEKKQENEKEYKALKVEMDSITPAEACKAVVSILNICVDGYQSLVKNAMHDDVKSFFEQRQQAAQIEMATWSTKGETITKRESANSPRPASVHSSISLKGEGAAKAINTGNATVADILGKGKGSERRGLYERSDSFSGREKKKQATCSHCTIC